MLPTTEALTDLGDQITAILEKADEEELKMAAFQIDVDTLADSLSAEYGIKTKEKKATTQKSRRGPGRRGGGNQDA